MNILIDLTSLADNFSGIERFALSITQELIKEKKNRYILVFKNKIYPYFEDNPSVENVVLKGNNKLIFNQLIFPIKLMQIKADCYFFPAFPAPFFFFDKSAINTIHDLGCWDCPECNKKYMIWYFKLMYWKASLTRKKIVTVSEFSKRRIQKILHVKEMDITVLYNGVSETFMNYQKDIIKERFIKQKYNLPEKYFLCLSTLEPRKNLRLLIDAYIDFASKEECPYVLVLAGRKGWMIDELLSNVSHNWVDHIHFTGFIDEEDLPAVYSMAECFIFPSLYEGFGIPPIEAMSVGTRVISSDSSSLPEVLGDAAVFFRSNDKEDLEKKIEYILEQKETDKQIQINNGIENCKRFTWSASAQRLLELMTTMQK